MLVYTIEQLNSKKVIELKEIAKGYGLKGFSKLRKSELADFIKKNEPSSFETPIKAIFNDSLNLFSVLHIDMNITIKEASSLLIQLVGENKFSNQVMSERELKICYRAGFRVNNNERLTESESIELLKDNGSVNMRANTTILNLIKDTAIVEVPETVEEVATVESIEETNTTIIEAPAQEETIETTEKDNNLFWYAYRLRGFSIGCQPSNHITWNDSIGKHGIVAYDRPLTKEELSSYELEPYKTPARSERQAIIYKVYNRTFTQYNEALQYCNESDFDPILMIEEIQQGIAS